MSRVLVFNFFGGISDRGIPHYVQGLMHCMRNVGLEPVELRGPAWLSRAPRLVRNLVFVLYEQAFAPALRVLRRCRVTVYPYNSAGLVDGLLGCSVMVVHDLIPNRRGNRSLSAFHVRLTQAAHRALGRPVCAASAHTLIQLRRLRRFRGCPLQLWTNSFYAFEKALERQPLPPPRSPGRPLRVLLCSGMGPNKDYAGAIRLFRRSRMLHEAELRIMGFGDDAALARRRLRLLPPQIQARASVLPRLKLDDVVREYLDSDLVWVHSHQEGFGRSLIEARLCGRPVVASNIAPFRRFADPCVSLYDDSTFEKVMAAALERGEPGRLAGLDAYHGPLECAVETVLGSLGVRARSASARLPAAAGAGPGMEPAAPGQLAPQPARPPRPPTRPGS